MKIYDWIAICLLCTFLVSCQGIVEKNSPGSSVPTKSSDADSWTNFDSVEGGFGVEMPSMPELSSEKVPTATSEIDTQMFTSSSNDITYLIAYSDYPATIIQKTTPDKILISARDGAIAKINGTLFEEQNISFAGFPGIEIKAASQDGKEILQSRFYLVSNRLYQVMTMSAKGITSSPEIDKFFNSFVLSNY